MEPLGPNYFPDHAHVYRVAPGGGPEHGFASEPGYPPDSRMSTGPTADEWAVHEPSSLFVHRDRDSRVILENDDERCTFRVDDGGVVRLQVEPVQHNYGSGTHTYNSWRQVTAFISTFVHAGRSQHRDQSRLNHWHIAPTDKWVVKVVYQGFQNRNNPQTKDVETVFECGYSECREMRTHFVEWVQARGFDILFDEY